jgi:anti-sigma regulatory factor (Ser/Thr protein kinase)
VQIVRILRPVANAPSDARSTVGRLRGLLSTSQLDDLRLTVSELVTNSVLHAGLDETEPIVLTLNVSTSRVRVEVLDPGAGFPPGPRSDGDGHVHGLGIVDRLADRCAIESHEGTRVWAEFRRLPNRAS